MRPDGVGRRNRSATHYSATITRTFSDRFELADSTNQLVAFNYGDHSKHTDEFVVFWFPRTKLLFEAELGWVRTADGKLRAGSRAVPLLAWLDEQKLGVDRIVQSWPMRSDPGIMRPLCLQSGDLEQSTSNSADGA